MKYREAFDRIEDCPCGVTVGVIGEFQLEEHPEGDLRIGTDFEIDKEQECATCDGTGSHECSCGDDHDCPDCDGTGSVERRSKRIKLDDLPDGIVPIDERHPMEGPCGRKFIDHVAPGTIRYREHDCVLAWLDRRSA